MEQNQLKYRANKELIESDIDLKIAFGFMSRLIMIVILFASLSLSIFSQANNNTLEDPNAKIFMDYLQNHWDDIHDVIIRFHNDDPNLKGIVFIHMDWQHGTLLSATVDSNNTGNQSFGQALVEAMNKWDIPGLAENWSITLPMKTEIMGSNHPEFFECGILTGNITDLNGNPVSGATLILAPHKSLNEEPDTFYSNREGIIIRTLIQAGDWSLVCKKVGYTPYIIEKLSFEKGEHIKKSIIMKK